MDFQHWLRHAASALSESESPKRDAEILLEHVTGKARTYLLAFGETVLSAEQESQLEMLLARRKTGEPVAHLSVSASSGHCRFMSLRPPSSLDRIPSVWWSRRWRVCRQTAAAFSILERVPAQLRWRSPVNALTVA